ncbi:MAG TPA: hypothetical protein VLH08_16110 [Acidobacteriota bacterium]|nr:hypothetical protein [Acidobacteriota bacterium]
MFCLKCGKQIADDEGFCRQHADDPYTEQTIQDELEQPHFKAVFQRCPRCNEEIFADRDQCPSCQFDLTKA